MSHRTGNPNDGDSKESGEKQVIDFNEVRAQKLDEKRRKTQRIFYKNLLSVYSVVGTTSNHPIMRPIELIEVSEDGCSFQIPFDPEKPWPTDAKTLPIRLYFSQDTYLEVHVTITNSRPAIENNARYVRFGCKIDTGTSAYAAYQQFVRFLTLYSEHAHKDMGDVTVFYI